MLVLGRKVGEQVVIAGSITVKVVAIKGNMVKLGFTAPDEIEINRQEVQDMIGLIEREKEESNG
jgi:carbon storage regulator